MLIIHSEACKLTLLHISTYEFPERGTAVRPIPSRIRLRRGTLLLVVLALLSVLAVAGTTARALASTTATPVYTEVMDSVSVNVCSDLGVESDGEKDANIPTCGGQQNVGNVVGAYWQCVEFAQRFYQMEGWHSGVFPNVNVAADIYSASSAGKMGMSMQNNGSITSLVPGDMIIHGYTDKYSPNAGHVAIVDHIIGSTVYAVQQNAPFGAQYTFTSGTLAGGSGTDILGVVHSPNNHNTGNGTAPPAPTDTDGDGVPDIYDQAPTIPGPVNNRGIPDFSGRLTGDFNGDGKADVATFYDYGGGTTGLFMSYGSSTGLQPPVEVWNSGTGAWNWNDSKPVVGDFNGDGYTDIAVLYQYDSGRTGLFVFWGSASGLQPPVEVWDSGEGNWNWANSIPLAGDFNGDGKADVAIMYQYDASRTGLFVMYGSSTGIAAPAEVWDSGENGWIWANSKPAVGDFNGDGHADIALFYEYDPVRTGLFVMYGSSTGIAAPAEVWDSGEGNWNWANTLIA